MVKKDVIDLIVAAAKKTELIDAFKKAKSATDLQKRWSQVKPGYFVSIEDCDKLLKGRDNIFKALGDEGVKIY